MRAVVNEWLIWAIKRAKDLDDLESFQRLIRRYNSLNGLEGDASGINNSRGAIVIEFSSDPETLKKQIAEMRRKAEAANAQDITPEVEP